MSSLSDYSETAMLNHMFNRIAMSFPATVYGGLFEGAPGDDGLGAAEPVGNGYLRAAISFGLASGRQIVNDAAVTFPTATGAWQTVQLDHYGIFDQQSGGNFLAWAPLANVQTVISGNTPSMAIGEIEVTLLDLITKGTLSNLSDAAANLMLNHIFGKQSWSVPFTYLGYAQAELNDATTGSTVTEPSGNAYARLLVNENGGGVPQWRLAAGNVIRNQDQLIMPTPTGSWGTLVGNFVADALSGGNILYFDNAMVDQLVGIDDTLRINTDIFQARIT